MAVVNPDNYPCAVAHFELTKVVFVVVLCSKQGCFCWRSGVEDMLHCDASCVIVVGHRIANACWFLLKTK